MMNGRNRLAGPHFKASAFVMTFFNFNVKSIKMIAMEERRLIIFLIFRHILSIFKKKNEKRNTLSQHFLFKVFILNDGDG
jgi:hypothetical protein